MNREDSRANGKTMTFHYSEPTVKNIKAAAGWLVRAAKAEGFEANYMALRDLSHSADEGNASRQLKKDTSAEELLAAYEVSPCGRLYLSARYKGTGVGIGIDTAGFGITVTLPEGCGELLDGIEKALA